MLQALQFGFLDFNNPESWKIVTDLDCLNLFEESTARTIVKLTVNDFLNLLRYISKLYTINIAEGDPSIYLNNESTKLDSDKHIYISFTNQYLDFNSTFFIQNIYLPLHISKESFPTKVTEHDRINPERETLQFILKYIFRKNNFWERQFEEICRLLKGKDALLLLPTGGGKSMVYQFASMLLVGRTVVIDPMISLMEDQIDNLFKMGIDRCVAIKSKIGDPNIRDEILRLFGQGEYIFVFIAPERFQTNSFRDTLRMLTTHTPISLIVVDEAHCVSEWGMTSEQLILI